MEKWRLGKLIDSGRRKCSITVDSGLEATAARRGAFGNVPQAVQPRGGRLIATSSYDLENAVPCGKGYRVTTQRVCNQ